ncbi:uncharacterized mitochondrial protein AtMg00810-like [Solanum tuberosum]|uniref:uncharacterized mitochondrial protein AtMg00810-like n=1 Tax=Solanum tuberosum TaxID=4113 RepID=UPI00073A1AAA|nr:PREDICTED: uncharacterized mitochondrial protein AtMg00810-like [Solanum tuberosum]
MSTPISTGVKRGKDEDSEKVDDSMYRSLICSLLYLTASRPNILLVVSLLSRLMHSPRDTHFTSAKRVLRYIKGTIKFGTFFPTSAKVTMNLIGYSNSDWGGGVDDSRSTSGYLFCLGTSCFSWSSRKQETTAQSTAEVEYIAAASAVNQAIWLRKLADIFTKSLPKKRFEDLRQRIGVCHKNAKEEWSNVTENPVNFVFLVMSATDTEHVELPSFQLNGVAIIWYDQWKKSRAKRATNYELD